MSSQNIYEVQWLIPGQATSNMYIVAKPDEKMALERYLQNQVNRGKLQWGSVSAPITMYQVETADEAHDYIEDEIGMYEDSLKVK